MFATSEEVHIDWFRLLVELKSEGYSLYAVSHFVDIPKSTLIGYQQGSQPLYQNGAKLLRFWSDATGKPQDWAPTINPYSFKA
jgi:hypothetical protein